MNRGPREVVDRYCRLTETRMRRHDARRTTRGRRSPDSFVVIAIDVLDERVYAERGGWLNDERIIYPSVAR